MKFTKDHLLTYLARARKAYQSFGGTCGGSPSEYERACFLDRTEDTARATKDLQDACHHTQVTTTIVAGSSTNRFCSRCGEQR